MFGNICGILSSDSGTVVLSGKVITITDGVNVRIMHNHFSDRHLHLINCIDVVVMGNTFEDSTMDIIRLKGCTRVRIENNYLHKGTDSGIVLDISTMDTRNTDIQIIGNSLTNMQTDLVGGNAAIQVRGNIGAKKNDTNLLFANNTITNPGKVGLGLNGIEDAVISNNLITHFNTGGEGIAFNGKNIAILNNRVLQAISSASCCLIWGDAESNGYISENYRILNNYFEKRVAGGQIIAIVVNENDQVIDNIRIHGNILRGANFALQGYSANSPTGVHGVDNLFFTGNWIQDATISDSNLTNWPIRNITLIPNP